MTHRTFWRVAAADYPLMGFGTFWATSEHGAHWFAGWILRPEHQSALIDDGQHLRAGARQLYRVDLDIADSALLDLTAADVVFVSSRVLLDRAGEFAAKGLEWVVFYEGVVEGEVIGQGLYLGQEPLPVEVVEKLP